MVGVLEILLKHYSVRQMKYLAAKIIKEECSSNEIAEFLREHMEAKKFDDLVLGKTKIPSEVVIEPERQQPFQRCYEEPKYTSKDLEISYRKGWTEAISKLKEHFREIWTTS